MLVQIHGAGFHNRGAQLMLWHTMQCLGEGIPDITFAMEPIHSTFRERANYGLLTCFPGVIVQRPRLAPHLLKWGDFISSFVPNKFANNYGIARRCDIDAFIDISGYSFGDKWGAANCKVISRRIGEMHKRKKPTVFMPQMFGPFEKENVREAFLPAFANASLVYARDEVSFECLKQINSTNREILLTPDITITAKPKPPADIPPSPYACVVPNKRMLDKTGGLWSERYIGTLSAAIKELQLQNIRPYVLIHDGADEDLAVGKKLLENVGLSEDSLLMHDDPLVIKGYIASSTMLIGSRFHAIVAALSTATPAIAIGWAHKYEMLLKDFGIPEFVFSDSQTDEDLQSLVRKLSDEKTNAEIVKTLKEKKEPMVIQSNAMWDNVINLLKSKAKK